MGGFGISSADDLLLIEDIAMVDQICTAVSVEFNDDAVADYFDEQVELGRKPEHFGRIWIHTHPGSCPQPSGTDEETFRRCFGSTDWAVMFILARHGASYGRLRFNTGPGTSARLRPMVDHSVSFPCSEHDAWQWEYESAVSVFDPLVGRREFWFEADGFNTGAESSDPDSSWEAPEWVLS